MKNKAIWLVLCCLIVAALVVPSLGKEKPKAQKPQYGGELKVHIWNRSIVGSWDPIDMDMSSIYPLDLIYERLGIADWTKAGAGTGEYMYEHFSWYPPEYARPHLLESWATPDGLTAILKLRKGIRFQDKPPVNGREVVANDVVYSIYRLSKSKRPGAWARYFASAKELDKYTVEAKFKSPYYGILRDMVYGGFSWVQPHEMVEKHGNLKDWRNACGTGPFLLKDYVPQSQVTFTKNPNYWCNDELNPKNRLPYVDTVKELLISDDAAQLAALRTGKIDLTFAIPYDKHKTLKRTAKKLKWRGITESSRDPMFMFRVDEPPFNDVRVRRAMQMAVNYPEIIDSFFDGNAVYRAHPIMPMWGGYYIPDNELPDDVKELFSYNPEKAKRLLAEAGHPNGFKTKIVTMPVYEDRAFIFSDYWKKIGVQCELKILERAAFLGLVYGNKAHGIFGKGSGIASPVWAVQYFMTGNRFNNGAFSDPEYDALVNEMVTTTDQEKLRELVKKGTLQYYRKVPCLSFPLGNLYNYWQPWVKNYHGEYSIGGAMGQYVVLSRLWIDQKLRK
jgi:peptide/nickel transport system substrate-binding protein